MIYQKTIANPISFTGIGLHTGKKISVCLQPANANFGIRFVKEGGKKHKVSPENVFAYSGYTAIGTEKDNIKTIEHLLSALSGCRIDNCLVEVIGDEIPISDGSAKSFIKKLDFAGKKPQSKPRRYIEIMREVKVEKDGCVVSVSPNKIFTGLTCEVEIDFPFTGKQKVMRNITPEIYKNEVGNARTFASQKIIDELQANGLVKGASLKTGIGIDNDGNILNEGGLRFKNELAIHKMLDSVGDLYSLGNQLIGHYKAYKPGHVLNNLLCKKILSDEKNYRIKML